MRFRSLEWADMSIFRMDAHGDLTRTLIVGTNNPDHLARNLNVLDNPGLTDEDNHIIERIRTTDRYKAYLNRKRNEFFE